MPRDALHTETELNFGMGEFKAEVEGEMWAGVDRQTRQSQCSVKIDRIRIWAHTAGAADIEISEDTAREMFLKAGENNFISLWDFATEQATIAANRYAESCAEWAE